MTFSEYWAVLMTRNAIKEGSKVVMSREAFKKMQEQAFNIGFSEAEKQRGLFESVFGKSYHNH